MALSLQQIGLLLLQFVPLPVAFATVGTSVGRFLGQDGLPKVVNDVMALVVLVGAAIFDALMSNQLTGSIDWLHLVSIVSGFMTLLLAGPLTGLRPYVAWLNFLHGRVFTVIRPGPQFTALSGSRVLTQRAPGVPPRASAQAQAQPGTDDHGG